MQKSIRVFRDIGFQLFTQGSAKSFALRYLFVIESILVGNISEAVDTFLQFWMLFPESGRIILKLVRDIPHQPQFLIRNPRGNPCEGLQQNIGRLLWDSQPSHRQDNISLVRKGRFPLPVHQMLKAIQHKINDTRPPFFIQMLL